jgi:SAM-dependent methyltransferase
MRSYINSLNNLSREYGYDINHNLRYIKLVDLILELGLREICVLGCGFGIVEYLLPDFVYCLSYDIDQSALAIAQELNKQKLNRKFVKQDILSI